MNCKRCEKILCGKQTSYCSQYCSKLHLKSLYRKRKRLHISEYKKKVRKGIKFEYVWVKNPARGLKINGKCRSCNSTEKLTINHVVPLSIGGGQEITNLEILCVSCNSREYHKLVKSALKEYFKSYFC